MGKNCSAYACGCAGRAEGAVAGAVDEAGRLGARRGPGLLGLDGGLLLVLLLRLRRVLARLAWRDDCGLVGLGAGRMSGGRFAEGRGSGDEGPGGCGAGWEVLHVRLCFS